MSAAAEMAGVEATARAAFDGAEQKVERSKAENEVELRLDAEMNEEEVARVGLDSNKVLGLALNPLCRIWFPVGT
jgi:hypothetical protein